MERNGIKVGFGFLIFELSNDIRSGYKSMIFTKLSDFGAGDECIGIKDYDGFSSLWHERQKVEIDYIVVVYNNLGKFSQLLIWKENPFFSMLDAVIDSFTLGLVWFL